MTAVESDDSPSQAMTVDWGPVIEVCETRAVTLDRNDPDFLTSFWQDDHDRLARRHPIEHKPTCNLHPGYSKDPKVWARGCDCGATERAAHGDQ